MVTVVDIPTIALPSSTPHYSNTDTLTISGMCMSGFQVALSGDASETQTCANSTYSFSVLKALDGLYSFQITQSGETGTTSAGAPLVWVKKTSVAPPTITSPTATPFASAQSTLSIVGGCETGATVTVSGDSAGSFMCASSLFAFSIPKLVDGDYNFVITQTDRAGNSATSNILWRKYGITVSPSNPSLVVATPQVLTISGGSGSYTVSVSTNNSGGSYTSGTRTYTTGTLAAVTDTLLVTDSLGATQSIAISTVAGAVDHLSLPLVNGDAQVKPVGQVLDEMLSVKVVDRYENGISNYQVYFQIVEGDGEIVGNPVKSTNAQGLATVSLRTGFANTKNEIFVSPLSGALPDLAATGRSVLTMAQTTTSNGKGTMGTTFTVGSGPTANWVGDLNQDGYRDLLVLNSSEPSIGILLGRGNGLFGNMSRITGVCNSPSGLTVASLNSTTDAFLDLALSCAGADAIVVYTGRGDGTFNTPATVISTAPNATLPLAITNGDFNRDGYLDLAIASIGGSVVATYSGNGAGAFSNERLFNVGLSPNAITTLDIDKDSYLDIAVTNAGDNTLSILNGDGAGMFDPQTVYGTGIGAISMGVADFDKNTWPDLAVAINGEDTVSVFLNDGTGLLDAPNGNVVGVGPISLSIFDYDSDGNDDIVTATNGDNSLSILPGLGNGAFGGAITQLTVINPAFVSVADSNGDNIKDLFVSGDGKVEMIPVFSAGKIGMLADVGATPADAILAHFDSDVYLDMAVANNGSNTITTFTGDGKGSFTFKETLATGLSPVALKKADFNHDGYADLVVANNSSSSVRVYRGKSDGTFEPHADFTTGSGPTGIAIQDFNHDGHDDLAVSASNANKVSILLGVGDGTFGSKVDYSTGSSPAGVTSIDLDGDMALDLITANNSSNDVSVLIGNGDGTFRSNLEYVAGNGPASIVSADFNNDGNGDVAVLNSTDATVSVLRGVGDGSLTVNSDFSAGLTPVGLITGDFNGDTRIDLATGNGSSFGFTTLNGAGNGQFNVTNSFTTDYPVNGIGLGDVNGDFTLDFIILDSGNSKARTWLGQ